MPGLLSPGFGGECAHRRPLRISLARHAHAANSSLEQGYFITCVLQFGATLSLYATLGLKRLTVIAPACLRIWARS